MLASIPAVGFGATDDDVRALADAGYFVIKVKLGHPGSQDEMLDQDKRRIEQIHRIFGGRETEHTASRRIPYYFDLNGRYDSIDRLRALIEHADAIGALDQILVVEEPFPEGFEADVSQVGVRLAADEGAHTDEDARRLLDMGYGAIALKPVAKTVSMTFKIAAEAHRRNVPCFCADLTVNPILVDWNKSFAARLAPLPGLSIGLLETNGHQNYLNWERMVQYHPFAGASWMQAHSGAFHLNDDFYERSGGLFDLPQHYADVVLPKLSV
jgi:L-alanine-DL-glutamate epimerase-like enolase superfamily enzyme